MIITPLGSVLTLREIQLSLADGAILGLVLYVICFFIRFKRKKLFQNVCLCLLFAYVGFLVAATQQILLPMGWSCSAEHTKFVFSTIRWEPFSSAAQIFYNCITYHHNLKTFFWIVGGNFLILMPLGVLAPLLSRKYRFWRTLLLGLIVSLSIEMLQLVTNLLGGARTVEMEDVLLNTLGCAVAYLVFLGVRKLFRVIEKKA